MKKHPSLFPPFIASTLASPRVLTKLTASFAFLSFLNPLALADNRNWTGGTSSNWATGGNWLEGAAPVNSSTADVAIFSGTPTANQPNISSSRSIAGLIFETASGGWQISGANLNIGSRGIDATAQSSGEVTFDNLSVNISTGQSWLIGTGASIVVNGRIDGGGTLTIGSSTSASSRSGTVTFKSASTGTSSTLIYSGTVILASEGTLSNGGLALNNAAGTLDISGISSDSYTVSGSYLTGRSTIVAAGKRVVVTSLLSPGITSTTGRFLEGSTGLLTIAGAGSGLTLGTATTMDIAGATRGAAVDGYDAVDVTGVLSYAGIATINLNEKITGTFNLFDFSDSSGNFDAMNVTGAFGDIALLEDEGVWSAQREDYRFVFTNSTGNLEVSVIPEASSLGLALSAGLALAAMRYVKGCTR